MRNRNPILLFLYVFAICPWLPAQTSMPAAELEQLKSMVRSQRTLLEQQQAQIQALQLSLAEQKQILAGIVQPHTQDAKQVPAATTLTPPSPHDASCGNPGRRSRAAIS